MREVHFVLRGVWYDKIEAGHKNVEYRKNTSYWRKRVEGAQVAVFHRGYTSRTMRFMIREVRYGPTVICVFLGGRLR